MGRESPGPETGESMKLATYSKLAVSVAGAALTGLETSFAGAHWLPPVTAAISAVLVYLVPNVTAGPGRPAAGPGTGP